jgi:ZIP family zinc transporter
MATLLEVVVVAVAAGAATGVGAVPVLVVADVPDRAYDAALGFAAGVMLAAVAFALVAPGIEAGSSAVVAAGVLVGGGAFLVGTRLTPRVGARFGPLRNARETPGRSDDRRRALLVALAVTLDNAPEGLAVGVAFGSGLDAAGYALAAAIALQNLPDGFVMAVPAVRSGISRPRAVAYATLSGGVPEPLAAVAGFLLVGLAASAFPVAAGFAAGAVLAVVARELLPSSQAHGHADAAVASLLLGFVAALLVDAGVG